jgi:hypothetical protein
MDNFPLPLEASRCVLLWDRSEGRVLYLTNLQRTDSLEIPVGIVGEATLPSLRDRFSISPEFRRQPIEARGSAHEGFTDF